MLSSADKKLADQIRALPLVGLPKENVPYFAAIGKLFIECAAIEAEIHIMVRKLSGMSDQKARITLGGMRTNDLQERLRKLLKLRKQPITTSLVEGCLQQLKNIDTARDKFAHRSVHYYKDHLYVTNKLTVKSKEMEEIDKFSLGQIANMLMDCSKILLRLDYVRKCKFSDTPPTHLSALLQFLISQPWQYTPPRPAQKKTKHRGNPQLKMSLPQPSRD